MNTSAEESMDRERIAPALGKISSGIYVATASLGDEKLGLLCSFVEQCSFAPPMITIAVGANRPLVQALDGHGLFGLHVLSKQNNALMKSFARSGDSDPFAAHEMVDNLFGIPQLAEAWAFLSCKVSAKMPAGDHILYVAEVFDGALQHPGQEANVRVRPNGFTY